MYGRTNIEDGKAEWLEILHRSSLKLPFIPSFSNFSTPETEQEPLFTSDRDNRRTTLSSVGWWEPMPMPGALARDTIWGLA